MDDYEDDWYTTEAMRRYGGSFVQGLGQLYRAGDAVNQAKLKIAFADYFVKYRHLAKTLHPDHPQNSATKKDEESPC